MCVGEGVYFWSKSKCTLISCKGNLNIISTVCYFIKNDKKNISQSFQAVNAVP